MTSECEPGVTKMNRHRESNKNTESLVNVSRYDLTIANGQIEAGMQIFAVSNGKTRAKSRRWCRLLVHLLNYLSFSVRYQDRNRCLACHHLTRHMIVCSRNDYILIANALRILWSTERKRVIDLRDLERCKGSNFMKNYFSIFIYV